jgi:4-hydroxy-3-methylbut-2-enyl diphosphate reductase
MSRTLVVTALRTERAALYRHVAGAVLECSGMGADRARRWSPAGDRARLAGAVIAGLGGALDPQLRAGDVVVATSVCDALGSIELPYAGQLAERLADAGHPVHVGPIVTSPHVVTRGAERERLAATGAIALDMESSVLARTLLTLVPVGVVRIIVDTPTRPLLHLATISAGIASLRRLRAIGPIIGCWEGPRDAAS